MYVSKLLHLEAVVLTVLLLLQYSCILFADDSSDESTQKGPQRTGILIRQLKPRRHRPNSDESCPTCSSNRKPLPPSPDFVAIDQNIATENNEGRTSNSISGAYGCAGGGVLRRFCQEIENDRKKTEETRRKPSKSSSGGVGGALRDWVIERDDTAEVPKKTKENIQSSPNSQIEDKNSGSTSVNQMAGGGQQEPDDGGEQPGGGQKTGDKSDSDETKIDDTTRDTDDTTTPPTPTQDPTILPTVPGCPRKDPHFPLKNASVCFTKPPSPDNAKCECQMKPPCVSFMFPELGTKQQQWPSLPNIPIELKKINRMSDVVGINSSAPKNICSYVIVMIICTCILVCFICTLWQHR